MTSNQYSRLLGATIVLLLTSVTVNVVQAAKLRAAWGPRQTSAVGQGVAPLSVVDAQGVPHTIRFDTGLPTVIYYFSSTCSWCERNWDNVRALADKSRGRYRVVAVSSESSLSSFVDSHSLPFEVYGGITDSARWSMAFGATPRTVVVSPNGIVRDEWDGAYRGSVARSIEETFELRLPGVRTVDQRVPKTAPQ